MWKAGLGVLQVPPGPQQEALRLVPAPPALPQAWHPVRAPAFARRRSGQLPSPLRPSIERYD
jgi:hypothetical protein